MAEQNNGNGSGQSGGPGDFSPIEWLDTHLYPGKMRETCGMVERAARAGHLELAKLPPNALAELAVMILVAARREYADTETGGNNLRNIAAATRAVAMIERLNLDIATAIDKERRLDAGDPTERVETVERIERRLEDIPEDEQAKIMDMVHRITGNGHSQD